MQPLNFEENLRRITEQDPRYHLEAYLFLREALDYTQKLLGQDKKPEPRHVTGQELLSGIRDYALAQFGPMAMAVLNDWGVQSCSDFGEIVFNMVDHGLLSKTETDSRDDFKGGYDFDQAFRQPFRPRRREPVSLPPGNQASQP